MASRTKVAIAWTLDSHEMRGDKIELLSSLETKVNLCAQFCIAKIFERA